RAMVKTALPPFMQPATITLIDSLPLMASGKLDHAALLALEPLAPVQSPADSAAGSRRVASVEASARAAVARAWQQTLDRAPFLPARPFEEAGGDSLRLLQFVFRLEQQCGRPLPLEAFSGTTRPSDFAPALDRLLDEARSGAGRSPTLFLLPGMGGDEPRL